MTPHTATSLSQVLKETWNEDVFKKAFDLEVQGSDMRQQAQRQFLTGGTNVRFTGEPGGGAYANLTPTWIGSTPQPQIFDMSPKAVHARKARQDEMLQLYAARKRGNKPSYRQRQKNGRAGRK